MGSPETDPSAYQPDQTQIQTEYDLQPQEYPYQSEAASATPQQNDQQQDNYQPQQNDQQQFQPPPPPQPQPGQYRPPPQSPIPQAHQAYHQPQQQTQPPVWFPPPQTNLNGTNHPTPYPPPSPPPKANQPYHLTQAQQTQPVQFPPQSPYQPVAYPPQGPQTMPPESPYPPKPVQYSPASYPSQNYVPPAHMAPPPQYGQAAQPNAAATGIPMQNQYPPAGMHQQVGTEGWKTELFGCMDDPTNALITAFFPCLTFGQIAEIVDNGQTSCATSGMLYGLIAFCIAVPCIMSCTYRTKMRSRFGLIESPAPDWITHFLCEPCALCQEYRELQLRGLDPSIGWLGNVSRNQNLQAQQQQVGLMPPMNQRMMG